MLLPPPLPTIAHTCVAAVAAVAVVAAVILVGSRREGSDRTLMLEAAAIALGLIALVVLTGVAPQRWGVRRAYGASTHEAFEEQKQQQEPKLRGPTPSNPALTLSEKAVGVGTPPGAAVNAALKQEAGRMPSAVERMFQSAPRSSATDATATSATSATSTTSNAAKKEAKASKDKQEERLEELPAGCTLYVTCLDSRSYPPGGTGKTWKNVFSASSSSAQSCGSADASEDRDFVFSTAPAFAVPDGFALGQNVITGPLSHRLGVDGDRAFTLAALFQPTGPAPSAADPAVVFQLFANTKGNNGFEMTIHQAPSPSPSHSSYPCVVSVRVGSDAPIVAEASGVALDPSRRYLIVATKDRGVVRASIADIDAKAFAKQLLLAGSAQGNASERLRLSNVDMLVNAAANWNANLLAFGVWSKALGDADLGALYVHYSNALRQFDPDYQRLKRATDAAALATSCPYDAKTCAACGGVTDWSAASDALYTAGGTACHTAIDKFCTANPSSPRCRCWDTSNPEYGRGCASYRSVFSSAGGPAATCPKPSSAPPPPNPVEQVVNSMLSPANVEAVTKLIGAVRGPQHHPPHHHHKTCPSGEEEDDGRCPSPPPKRHHHRKSKEHDGEDDDGSDKKGFWASLFG